MTSSVHGAPPRRRLASAADRRQPGLKTLQAPGLRPREVRPWQDWRCATKLVGALLLLLEADGDE